VPHGQAIEPARVYTAKTTLAASFGRRVGPHVTRTTPRESSRRGST
jgi:hypothetical protein